MRLSVVALTFLVGCSWFSKTPNSHSRVAADSRPNLPESNPVHYGADPSGSSDSLQGFVSAIDAVRQSHGIVKIPPGRYSLSNTIIFQQIGVSIVGSGGTSQWGGTKQVLSSAATVLMPTGNFPAIEWDLVTDGSDNSAGWWSQLRDIAILGNAGPLGGLTWGTPQHLSFNNQHGIVVNNGGLIIDNVTIANVGGHGLFIKNSTGGRYTGVRSTGCHGDGLRMDGSLTNNTFTGCGFLGNGGDGIRMVMGCTGNLFLGCDTEQNFGYAISIRNDDPSRGPVRNTSNRFVSQWEEVNGGFVDTSGLNGGADRWNHFDFAHSTTPADTGAGGMGFPNGDSQVANDNTFSYANEHWMGSFPQHTAPDQTRMYRMDQFFAVGITRAPIACSGVCDINIPDVGSNVEITLLSDSTVTFLHSRDSMMFYATIVQGVGGSKVTWSSDIQWKRAGVPPVLATNQGDRDTFLFTFNMSKGIYYQLN